MINCYSYCTCMNTQTKFIETRLFFKQIRLNLALFGWKNWMNFRQENYVLVTRNSNTYLWRSYSHSINYL